MTSDELDRLLYELPLVQHNSARSRIEAALRLAWTNIDLWAWDVPADWLDLVGVKPNGQFAFLTELDDENETTDEE